MLKHAHPLATLIVAFAVLWHLLSALAPPRVAPPPGTEGRDFASYYYAAQVARQGDDPYSKANLDAAAQADGTRDEVHPFFYPPPFLLSVAWAPSLGLLDAFSLWFWINELILALAVIALWQHWRPIHQHAGPAVVLAVALSAGVAYSQELGQANFAVFALIAWALHQEERRPWLAGILLGTACMWKMSPALLVAWWLLRRQWVAAGAAVGWALVLSVLSLPLVGLSNQIAFYTQVLPRFGSGDYNGLQIQIGMFANHSVPNLLDQVMPGADNRLSGAARAMSGLSTLGLVGALGFAFRRPTVAPMALAAQASAVMVAMLLIPVYTYEHHLVFALPALVVCTLAVANGRLGLGPAGLVGLSWAVLSLPVPSLRQLVVKVVGDGTVFGWLLQESKFGVLLILLVLCAVLGARDEAVAESAG